MKDFLLREVVLDGHDELEISQLSLLQISGRTGNEWDWTRRSQVWSAGAGLIHLHIDTHAHTHTQTQKTEGLSWGWCKSMQRLHGWGWSLAEILLGQGVCLEHTCCHHEYLLNQPPHTSACWQSSSLDPQFTPSCHWLHMSWDPIWQISFEILIYMLLKKSLLHFSLPDNLLCSICLVVGSSLFFFFFF